jgi:hypothetical protein
LNRGQFEWPQQFLIMSRGHHFLETLHLTVQSTDNKMDQTMRVGVGLTQHSREAGCGIASATCINYQFDCNNENTQAQCMAAA